MKGFRHLVPCGSFGLTVTGEVSAMEGSCPWHGGCDDLLCAIKLACDLAQSNSGLIEGEIGQALLPGRSIISTKGELIVLEKKNIAGLQAEIRRLTQKIRQLIAE